MHIALLICIRLYLSLLDDGLVVFISPLLSILSETGCHSHHLWTMLFLFSIFRSLRFPSSLIHPLFLSERRCLWLAPSTWLIKKAGRLTWRRRKHWCHFLIMYLFLKRAQCVRASLNLLRTGISPPYWTGGQMFHYCVLRRHSLLLMEWKVFVSYCSELQQEFSALKLDTSFCGLVLQAPWVSLDCHIRWP